MKTKKRILPLWPKIDNIDTAKTVARYAAGFSFFRATVMTTIAVLNLTHVTNNWMAYDGWTFIDVVIIAILGYYTLRKSRVASILALADYILGTAGLFLAIGSPGMFGEAIHPNLVWTGIYVLVYINGIRGCFAYQRRQRSSTAEASGIALKTSASWKVYSAVLASFVFGALGLRVYQVQTSPGDLTQTTTGGEQENLTGLVKLVRTAVVTITTYDSKGKALGQGSGFFVSKEGEIVTNHHVLQGASSGEIKMSDGTTHRIAAVLADDPDSDLAKIIVVLDDTPFLKPIATSPSGPWLRRYSRLLLGVTVRPGAQSRERSHRRGSFRQIGDDATNYC